jgi:hypothetical protein
MGMVGWCGAAVLLTGRPLPARTAAAAALRFRQLGTAAAASLGDKCAADWFY